MNTESKTSRRSHTLHFFKSNGWFWAVCRECGAEGHIAHGYDGAATAFMKENPQSCMSREEM